MKNAAVAALCVLLLFAGPSFAQNMGRSVKLSGLVTRPLTITVAMLDTMKHCDALLPTHDGHQVLHTGVAVRDLLALAGVPAGAGQKGSGLSRYLLVKSADGYQVIFSLAELDSMYSDRVIILAYQAEGRPLPEDKGPFRIVVQGDQQASRSSFRVTELLVRDGAR